MGQSMVCRWQSGCYLPTVVLLWSRESARIGSNQQLQRCRVYLGSVCKLQGSDRSFHRGAKPLRTIQGFLPAKHLANHQWVFYVGTTEKFFDGVIFMVSEILFLQWFRELLFYFLSLEFGLKK